MGCKIASGPIAGPLDSGFFIKLNLGRLAKTGVAILEAHRQGAVDTVRIILEYALYGCKKYSYHSVTCNNYATMPDM